MARLKLYSIPNRRYYSAQLCSLAFLFRLCSLVLLAIVPFFVAYGIPGFWVKESFYREQPNIKFQHQLIVGVSGQAGVIATWSSISNYNNLAGGRLRIPTVSSFEIDKNRDGLQDHLNISIQVPMSEGEDVHQVDVLLFFSCDIKRYAHVYIQGLALLQHSSPTPGRRVFVDGDLVLRQRTPFPWTGVVATSNVSVVDTTSKFASSYQLDSIVKNYKNRNETTRLQDVTKIWQGPRASEQAFVVDAFIRYPEQAFVYSPGFWQLMKFAWIQYLSVFIIFNWLFTKITTYVFENRLLRTAKTE